MVSFLVSRPREWRWDEGEIEKRCGELAELTRAAETESNQLIWYVAPTEKLAKRVIWRRLKQMTQHLWSRKPFEQEPAIHLTNGSIIEVKSRSSPATIHPPPARPNAHPSKTSDL